jgi:formylglycine-generating enzyme required for sulfatase activity
MPCISGQPLSARLQAGPLPERVAVKITHAMAKAMAVAHRAGVVHRDLKPSNVFLREGDDPVVMDFGLARQNLELDSKLVGSGALAGTLAYMAPELLASPPDRNSPSSDVYSMGVILFEMLTGRTPFEGSWQEVWRQIRTDRPAPPSRHAPSLSSELDDICLRALAKAPQHRFESMDALADALAPLLAPARRRVSRTAIAAALAALALGGYGWRSANVRWATRQIPVIEALVRSGRTFEAYHQAVRALNYLPGESKLTRLMPRISDSLTVMSQPSGARIYLSRFGSRARGGELPRKLVGTTPLLELVIPRDDYVISVEKEGYVPFQRTRSGATYKGLEGLFPSTPIQSTLQPVSEAPAGMVFIPGGNYRLVALRRPTDAEVPLDDYWIDRCEVTNREYKEFIDAGGYQNQQFWRYEFEKDGRQLSREEAMLELCDSTGQPGPRGWSHGSYPQGQGDHPVTGIAWYEAAAYAVFRGKRLPTIFQWENAARNGSTSPLGVVMPWGLWQGSVAGRANLSTAGAVPVGRLPFGMSPFGCYDMAGNVSEWCLNETSQGFIASGGSWASLPQAWGYFGIYPGFQRSDEIGFRCAWIPPDAEGDQGAMRINVDEEAPNFVPAPEAEVKSRFAIYEEGYDRDAPLNAHIIDDRETSEWRRQKIVFLGADGEPAPAYLFLPKNAEPPYQAIHLFPGGDVNYGMRTVPESVAAEHAPHIRHGRALFVVVLKGYLERDPAPPAWMAHNKGEIEFVIPFRRYFADLRRGLDYLETRDDIDVSRVAFLACSVAGPVIVLPAIEPRYAAVILSGAGIEKSHAQLHPAANPIDFAPLIKQPKLLIHGRFDESYPPATALDPLFDLLPGSKKKVLLECGHRIEPETHAREIDAFLDKEFGPVKPSDLPR